tara:strand:- start:3225 stop:4313 length:1089 start_codon:yes stop_codon:yes gene_type:complete
MIVLTEQMIKDFGLTGAMAGEIATPEDIAIMNATQPTDPMSASLRPRISPPKPEAASGGQAVPTPPPVTGTKATAPTSAASGPFSSLSDDQRRLLRFAAIKDAGLALQGKEGNTVAAILGDFTKRADMARKADAATQAAQAQANLYSSLLGGGAGGGSEGLLGADILSMNEDQLKQYKQQLFNAGMIVGPSGSPLIPLNILQAKAEQVDKQIQDLKAKEGALEQAKFLEPRVDAALAFLNPDGAVDPDTGEPVINPELANKLTRGFAAFTESEGYISFLDHIEVIKNVLTFKNLIELKKQGATFGALSENELRQISTLAGNMDVRAPQNVLKNLIQIQNKIKEAKERANNETIKNINFGPSN